MLCLLAEARSAGLVEVSVLAMEESVSLGKYPLGFRRSLRRPLFSVACRASVASDRLIAPSIISHPFTQYAQIQSENMFEDPTCHRRPTAYWEITYHHRLHHSAAIL